MKTLNPIALVFLALTGCEAQSTDPAHQESASVALSR